MPKAGPIDVETAKTIFMELEDQAESWLVEEGVPEEKRRKTRVALLRYHGQGGEIAVPWAETREEVEAAFTKEHRSLYGFALEAPIELVTLRVEATGLTATNPQARLAACAVVEPYGHTLVHFEGGDRDVPLVDRATLGAGASLSGRSS